MRQAERAFGRVDDRGLAVHRITAVPAAPVEPDRGRIASERRAQDLAHRAVRDHVAAARRRRPRAPRPRVARVRRAWRASAADDGVGLVQVDREQPHGPRSRHSRASVVTRRSPSAPAPVRKLLRRGRAHDRNRRAPTASSARPDPRRWPARAAAGDPGARRAHPRRDRRCRSRRDPRTRRVRARTRAPGPHHRVRRVPRDRARALVRGDREPAFGGSGALRASDPRPAARGRAARHRRARLVLARLRPDPGRHLGSRDRGGRCRAQRVARRRGGGRIRAPTGCAGRPDTTPRPIRSRATAT